MSEHVVDKRHTKHLKKRREELNYDTLNQSNLNPPRPVSRRKILAARQAETM